MATDDESSRKQVNELKANFNEALEATIKRVTRRQQVTLLWIAASVDLGTGVSSLITAITLMMPRWQSLAIASVIFIAAGFAILIIGLYLNTPLEFEEATKSGELEKAASELIEFVAQGLMSLLVTSVELKEEAEKDRHHRGDTNEG